MHPSRIRRFAKTASDLAKARHYEEAFALRWIAYEGLIVRAAIKALWMRGVSVKEAEATIAKLNVFKVMTLLRNCCGTEIHLDNKGKYRILKLLEDRSNLRHMLFHQANVPSKGKLKQLSDLLALTLDRPEVAFGKIEVAMDGTSSTVELGNPLVDLRRVKRPHGIGKKLISELILINEKAATTISDLTDDEVLFLFIPPSRSGI